MTQLGINDDEFIRGSVPMTKNQIRILALAKARISPADTVFDVGAGTGSLSIEAARLASQGRVVAIERNAEGIALIRANAAKFAVDNITVIHGAAPAALQGLPPCDAALIGGSGGSLPAIIATLDGLLKPGGRLIITAVTIETLYHSLQIMQAKDNYQIEAFGVQINAIRNVAAVHMMQALNPIHIITCTKNG